MRLFAAVWPPSPVRALLGDLARPALPEIRWTTAEQWHVTLAFYGEVAEDQVPYLIAALREDSALPSLSAAAVVGDRTTRLGRRVLCVPVAGLDSLAGAVGAATAPWLGDPRPFRGHLTLARGRRNHVVPDAVVGQHLTPGGTGPPPGWIVGEVCLVASTPAAAGQRYATVISVPTGALDDHP